MFLEMYVYTVNCEALWETMLRLNVLYKINKVEVIVTERTTIP